MQSCCFGFGQHLGRGQSFGSFSPRGARSKRDQQPDGRVAHNQKLQTILGANIGILATRVLRARKTRKSQYAFHSSSSSFRFLNPIRQVVVVVGFRNLLHCLIIAVRVQPAPVVILMGLRFWEMRGKEEFRKCDMSVMCLRITSVIILSTC
jgi:hypothetical protein